MRAVEEEQWRTKREKMSKGFGSLIGSPTGGAGGNRNEFKSWYEQERDRYQAAYLEEEKYWAEHGPEIRQKAKEDQERQLKEMKTNAWR